MDDVDRKILAELEQGLVLTSDPFDAVACELGIAPNEVVDRLNELRRQGVIRRFGAVIKPNSIGFPANALVAWKVPQSQVKEIGDYLSKLKEVSHCYERAPVKGRWEYNLYTVMHGRERGEVERLVSQISDKTGVAKFEVLFSTRDLRKAKLSRQGKTPDSRRTPNKSRKIQEH